VGLLAEHWTTVKDVPVFYRESVPSPEAPVMMHLHGFGLSGRYLVPTAERLAGEFHTLVPDLPGFGRSGRALTPLDVPDMADAAADFLDDRKVEVATLVGNSMGCPVICEFARHHPDRIDRAILVSPAGGLHNQPLQRAMVQLARDGVREPTRLMPVAVPDYLRFGVPSTLRLFRALTQFPALERLLELEVPTLVVVGDRDPLMPSPARIKEIATQYDALAALVVIEGAAHAINFSHPGELANVIRLFMADEPIVDDESSPGRARSYEFHRGARLPHRDAQDPGPSVEQGLEEQHEGARGAREQGLQAEAPPPEPDAVPRDEADAGEEQDRRPEPG
jgi:pimeloyl-ACP methyl ester carboxylesterase